MSFENVSLFSLEGGAAFADRVASELGITRGEHEERDFEDGEHKVRPLESVRNRDVFIVQSLHGDASLSVNDELIRLLFFLGALRDAGASRLHAITPYLCYTRKDRRTKSRDPLSIRYIAQLFEAIGIDSITAMDVHNPAAWENAFRCPTLHASAHELLVDHFVPLLPPASATVASPDIGGAKRAETFREALEVRLGHPVGSAVMYKHRSEGVVSGDLVAGDIEGRTIVIIDDLIAGGTTMRRAADAFVARGAARVYAAATHATFSESAAQNLAAPNLAQVVVTNTVAPPAFDESRLHGKLHTVDVAPVIAGAIARLQSSARSGGAQ